MTLKLSPRPMPLLMWRISIYKKMCITIPAKVISLEKNKAIVDFNGKKQDVDTQLTKVKVGDYVMASNGFVIKKINKKEAEEILKILKLT